MVFSSLLFLFRFLPAVLDPLLYSTAKASECHSAALQPVFLCVGRILKYVFLMLFTITMDFFIGKGIDKAKKEGNQKKGEAFSYDFNPCGSFHPWIF